MDFTLSEDQHALADLIRVIVAGRFSLERIRRAEEARQVVDTDDWAALGEAGVFSLTVPESDGGVGLGLGDAAVVFEELGRGLVPGPTVATHLATTALGLLGDGSCVVGVVRVEDGPMLVEHLDVLDHLVIVRTGVGLSVLEGDELAGVVAEAIPIARSLDPLTPLWRVMSLPEGRPFECPTWIRDSRVLVGALLVGMAAGAMDAAVAHAKQREQFGTPIGSFQSIKHLCADMLVRTETARAAVQAAAVTVDQADVGDADRLAAGAALSAADAALANASSSIQIHGGMGFTWEVPMHLYLMRARLAVASLGPLDDLAMCVAQRW